MFDEKNSVRIDLILGLFTGIAAFFGTTMNAGYLLALGSLLVLAWKTAGSAPPRIGAQVRSASL